LLQLKLSFFCAVSDSGNQSRV